MNWPQVYMCVGEGNVTPLQYSCLESAMDGGAWWAAVHGVAGGRTWLKWCSSSSSSMHACPLLDPLPPPSLLHPSGLLPDHGFMCPASCIKLGLPIYFTYGNVHVSMLFSQIIPPLPFPTESKSLLFTSVPPFLSCMQDHQYHLSKFHIYVLIYSIYMEFRYHKISQRIMNKKKFIKEVLIFTLKVNGL